MLINKNILIIIITNVSVFILTSLIFIYVFIPHYNEEGEYKLFGSYYNNKHTKKINNFSKNNEKLKNSIENYKNKNKSLIQNNKNFLETIKNNQQNLDYLQKQNNNLTQNISVLKSQLNQQQEFIKNQNIEHKQEKKQKEFIKKRQFSNVSKTNITNDRPQLGNMYSKSLKKTTTTTT